MSQRLVFGDDRSEHSDVAWQWINSHSWPEWDIEVVTVVPEGHEPSQAEAPRSLDEDVVAGQLDHRVLHGDPRRELPAAAEGSALLVIGPRGRGLLKALHLGSTAEALIQAPPVPLMLARSATPTGKALVAADGSAHAQAAEAALLSLPWADQLDVLVLAVSDADEGATVTSAAADRLGASVSSVETRVIQPDDLPVFFRPRDVLLDTVKESGIDLLVLGSQGLANWESVNELGVKRAGSTASAVAAHAPCSVLLGRANV